MKCPRVRCATTQEKTYLEGDTVVCQGDTGCASFHVLLRGKCDVVVDGVLVGSMDDGSGFGDVSLVLSKSREARKYLV